MQGALGSDPTTLYPAPRLLPPSAHIRPLVPFLSIEMDNLAVFPRLTSFSLHCGDVTFSPLAWIARHPLIGFSQRRSLKYVATASSSTAASVWTAEKEELARFTYAVKTGSNLVPLYRCIFCDHLTPILAYRCLVEEDRFEAPSFLFESVEHGLNGTSAGRYSVLGAHPAMEIVSKENMVSIVDHELGRRTEEVVDDPMGLPWRIMEGWSPHFMDELPDVFCGGWMGYFSYDTMRYVEKRRLPFSNAPEDDRNLPDVNLGLYNDVMVFDHVEKKAYVIHWVHLARYSSIDEAYRNGKNRLEALLSLVQNVELPRLSTGSVKFHTRPFDASMKRATMTKTNYKQSVLQAKEHIFAGDIFQVVLSQRFERRTYADPFEVYRALRVLNPSPYMAYVQARGCVLVASSPEILTCVRKRKIVSRPLAGTVRRGMTEKEDKMQEQKLLRDEKQRAEHIMLVDLARNDVGKVSKYGSVNVEKLMDIERYSHVMHISSTITGELFDHLNCWDALRAVLPAGTVTGAPKVRAMELIDKLELRRRGPYSGGFGGVSFNGNMDIALTLRTMVFPTGSKYSNINNNNNNTNNYLHENMNGRREWVAHLQAGAGIVADSNPEDEQRECENKVAALLFAIDLAEATFVDNL